MNRNRFLITLAILSYSLSLGCERTESFSQTESSNLKPLAVMYGRFISSNAGRGPKDEAGRGVPGDSPRSVG